MRLRRRQSPARSLSDPEKVDLVTQDPCGGANLYVVQDQPWIDSEARTESRERKLRTNANFAREGQMHKMYPELRGQRGGSSSTPTSGLKGANFGLISRGGLGGSVAWSSPSFTSLFGLCSVHW